MYKLRWSKQALKDAENIDCAGLKRQVSKIIGTVERNPYEPTGGHRFEKIARSPNDTYSRRINKQHRFIYTVQPNADGLKDQDGNPYNGIIHILSMWGHP